MTEELFIEFGIGVIAVLLALVIFFAKRMINRIDRIFADFGSAKTDIAVLKKGFDDIKDGIKDSMQASLRIQEMGNTVSGLSKDLKAAFKRVDRLREVNQNQDMAMKELNRECHKLRAQVKTTEKQFQFALHKIISIRRKLEKNNVISFEDNDNEWDFPH